MPTTILPDLRPADTNEKSVQASGLLGHFSKSDVRYWQPRIFHQSYTREGKTRLTKDWAMKIAHQVRRETFPLGTPNKAAAATSARDIYLRLLAHGWEPTLAKYKPKMVAPKVAADEAQGGRTALGTPIARRTEEWFPAERRGGLLRQPVCQRWIRSSEGWADPGRHSGRLADKVDPGAPRGVLLNAETAVLRGSLLIHKHHLKGKPALRTFEKETGLPRLKASKCPDFVLDRGPWFGEALSDDDKNKLIAFLKTL
jgi:hypothetical protein